MHAPCADRLDMMLRATRSVASRTVGLRSLKQTSSMGRICTPEQHALCQGFSRKQRKAGPGKCS